MGKQRPGWTRHGPKCGGVWEFVGTRIVVRHCGHPTALWPYYGVRPDGAMILHPGGRAFQFLKDCQEAVEREVAGENFANATSGRR